jgi:hypothetical protein
MPQTVRQFWTNMMGRNVLNFNWDAIDHDSVVLISASEYNRTTRQTIIGLSEPQMSRCLISPPMGRRLTQTMEFSLFFKSTGSHRSTS